jgi:hypothetical protein
VVLSLEAVDFLLVLVGHAGHKIVVVSVQLVNAVLVCGVDFLNSLHVFLVALSGTLLEALDLRAKCVSLNNKLLLIAAVLISILSNLDRCMSNVGLQLTTLDFRVTEEFLVHNYVFLEIVDDL